jgi:hypothetical protein
VLATVAVLVSACGGSSSAADQDLRAVDTSAPTTTAAPTTSAPTTTTTQAPPTTTEPPPPPPPPPAAGAALGPGSTSVYVLGDSVILGAQANVAAALGGWSVTFDAEESRRIDQGTDVVRSRGGAMGRVLVVHLCTNWGGGDYRAAAGRLLGSLSGVERVVWVTCTPWLPAVGAADQVIRDLPASHPNVVVADWAAISGGPGFTYSDGLHLKPAGAAALARLVADAVGPAPG